MSDFSDHFSQTPESPDQDDCLQDEFLDSVLPSQQDKVDKLPAETKQAGKGNIGERITELDHQSENNKGPEEIALRERALALAESDPSSKDLSLAYRHSHLAELYSGLDNNNKNTEHFKKAAYYWQAVLVRASKDGDTAFREGKIPEAINHYKNAITDLDRDLFDIWSRRSPAPGWNPVSSVLYERLAKANLAKLPPSEANLIEASRYYQLAASSLIEYNERFGDGTIEPKQPDLAAAALETECRLIAGSSNDKKHQEHLLVASDLLEGLTWLESQSKGIPASAKSDNYGHFDPSLIPIFKEIAKFQVDPKTNERFDIPGPDGIPGYEYAHRTAVSALERVYAMQTKKNTPKNERLDTLLELANQYIDCHDNNNLPDPMSFATYMKAIRLAGEDKDLLKLLKPPQDSPDYFDRLSNRQLPPNKLAEIQKSMGISLFEFSKEIRRIADQQSSENSPMAKDNYGLALSALNAALLKDYGTVKSTTLLDLLTIIDKVSCNEIATEVKASDNTNNNDIKLERAKDIKLREQAEKLCKTTCIFADENFNQKDPKYASLLTKIADFHLRTGQYESAIEVLQKYRSILHSQSEALDKKELLAKQTDLYGRIADTQSHAGRFRSAVETSMTSLDGIKEFFCW